MKDKLSYLNIIKNLTNILTTYIRESNLDSLFININNVSSVVCAAISRVACEACKIPLIGKSFIAEEAGSDLHELGKFYCTDYSIVQLPLDYEKFDKGIDFSYKKEFEHAKRKRKDNLTSRIGMAYMYNIAKYYNGIVLDSTDLTDFLLGEIPVNTEYDFSMFRELWKSEVLGIVEVYIEAYNEHKVSDKKINNFKNSLDDYLVKLVYWTYDTDIILAKYLNDDITMANHEVIEKYFNSWHKRNKPFIALRNDLLSN